MTGGPIAVLLADDHRVLRDGLRVLINAEPDMTVVGEAESGEEALELVRELRPHVVVMDLGMPGMSGMAAIREIRRLGLECRIVVLSMHGGREVVSQAMKAGCDGYVPKSSAHVRLLEAIREVHAGRTYLHPEAASAVVSALVERERKEMLLEGLSSRERQVLRLLALGYTSREIGQRLSLSPKTVDTYRARAMRKLNLEHRADLVRFALRSGLISEGE